MRRRTGLEALEKMTIHEEAHMTGGGREDDDVEMDAMPIHQTTLILKRRACIHSKFR